MRHLRVVPVSQAAVWPRAGRVEGEARLQSHCQRLPVACDELHDLATAKSS